MTDTELPPNAEGSRSFSRIRQFNWRPRAQWFAAEFLVVVSGILVALWLQAWYQSRQQAARETDYLGELAAELRQAEATIEATSATARRLERAGAMLVQSFYPGMQVPEDSIRRWLFQVQSFSSVGLSLSTARALAAQEAGFVQDDSVRIAVLALVDQADQFHTSQESGIDAFLAQIPELMNKVSFSETLLWQYDAAARDSLVTVQDLPGYPVPPGTPIHPFPADIDILFRDRELFRSLEALYQIHASFARSQGRMLMRVQALRERVESVLEKRSN